MKKFKLITTSCVLISVLTISSAVHAASNVVTKKTITKNGTKTTTTSIYVSPATGKVVNPSTVKTTQPSAPTTTQPSTPAIKYNISGKLSRDNSGAYLVINGKKYYLTGNTQGLDKIATGANIKINGSIYTMPIGNNLILVAAYSK